MLKAHFSTSLAYLSGFVMNDLLVEPRAGLVNGRQSDATWRGVQVDKPPSGNVSRVIHEICMGSGVIYTPAMAIGSHAGQRALDPHNLLCQPLCVFE